MNSFVNRLQLFTHRPFAVYGPSPKIAIIGNGGLTESDQEGIDNADCVIRFNNYATRPNIKYSADRFRCNMLFTTGDLHSDGAEPSSVVIGIPYPFKCKEIARKMNKWYSSSQSYMVNPYLNMIMCEEMGIPSEGHKHPIPSIGFTCLWHLFHLMETIRGFNPEVFIAGFNWYWDDKKKTIQGWDMKKTNYPTHWNHNYPKEVLWMISKLMHHPSFSFSESSFSILQQVSKMKP